jgi:flagellar biosynthesis GTPase FlhF
MVDNHQKNDNIDDLISQIKQEKINKKIQSVPQSDRRQDPTDDLLKQLKSDFKKQKEQEKVSQLNPPNHQVQKTTENLTDIKQQFQEKKEHESQKITHQNQAEIRYTEQRKQQQQKLLTRQAKQWLESLDKYSDEGLWFEEFSHSYPSQLEAAIEYLGVLNPPS